MIWTAATPPAPKPSPPSLLVQDTVPCFRRGGDSLCKQVHRITHSDWLAESSEWLIAKPAKILLIVVVAVLLKKLVHKAIDRLCRRASNGALSGVLASYGRTESAESALIRERRKQRAATMASVLRSVSTGVIYSIALLMSLSELTFNIGPLIASAGIIGVAIGFGAQTLVKDFLSGVFMILEDQYGVGDTVDVGNATGVVEAVGLRVTRIRGVDGTVWYVRNGEIARVGNQSQGWSRVVIDVEVAHGEDIDRLRTLLAEAGERLMASESASELLDAPEVWGVQALTSDTLVMRVVVKTQPGARFAVGRRFREIISTTLQENSVSIGRPDSTVWLRTEGTPDSPSSPFDTGGTGAGFGSAPSQPPRGGT